MTPQAPPQRQELPQTDQRFALYGRVKGALRAMPVYFDTETVIAGIMATDIHTLGAVLGATIEEQVVKTLNRMRDVWDPDDDYPIYSFVRQAQVFPDVILRRPPVEEDAVADVLMGIELKSWYLLAKEGEPSFRFQATEAACHERDVAMVVPWALSRVISGSPVIFEPYVVEAKYAAQYRNYHWQNVRDTQLDTAITAPQNAAPYPSKSDEISDKPASDSGGNFGRLARTGMMDEYVQTVQQELLGGIAVKTWRDFFSSVRSEA